MPELWTVARVALHLDISRKRVYQMIAAGRIKSLKLSARTTRVTRDSVEAFLNSLIERQRGQLGLDVAPAQSPHLQRPKR